MSMLQKILEDMFVEPELLAELDEDQKQILFCKMREEQLRRWSAREKELEEKEQRPGDTAEDEKASKIQFLLGADGNPWVWVMGEHPDDPTIEELWEMEAQQQAQMLAENEAAELRRKEEESLKEKLHNEVLELESLKIQLNGSSESKGDVLPSTANSSAATSFSSLNVSTKENNHLNNSTSLKNTTTNSNHTPTTKAQSEVIVPIASVPLPAAVAKPAKQNGVSGFLNSIREARLTSEKLDAERKQREMSDRLQREKDEQTRREAERIKEQEELAAKLRNETEQRVQQEVQRRQSLIFERLKEERQKTMSESEREEQETKKAFEDQERKAREAEEQIREIARRARNRLKSEPTSLSLPKDFDPTQNHSITLPRPSKPKSRKAIVEWFLKDERPCGTGLDPRTKEVASWFHGIISRTEAEELLELRSPGSFLVRVSERIWGFAVSFRTNSPASKNSSIMLDNSVNGNNNNGSTNVKHFLIERVPGGYQFMGTNQILHKSLADLVNYHMKVSITTKGGEVLLEPAGQIRYPPDYRELFSSPLYSSEC